MNTVFRILNVLLLAAILAILFQVRQHMPSAIGEFRQVNRDIPWREVNSTVRQNQLSIFQRAFQERFPPDAQFKAGAPRPLLNLERCQ